jgi:hypothetical protein
MTNSTKESNMKNKHGMSGTKLYWVWENMKKRCFNKNYRRYEDYGGRGITIIEAWLDPTIFMEWALANGYDEKLQIDRKDNDGNYEPDNCRFVSPHINNCNQRKRSTNKSGYTGVRWHKNAKKWYAQITIHRKEIHLGTFNTKKEAVEARNKYITDNSLSEYKIQPYEGETQ